MATAVEVVELALGDRVIHVNRREEKFAGFGHLVETMDASGGFLTDPADVGRGDRPVVRLLFFDRGEELKDTLELRVVRRLRAWNGAAGGLEFESFVDEQGRIAASSRIKFGPWPSGQLRA